MRPPFRCSMSLGKGPKPSAICGCTGRAGRLGRPSCSMSTSPAEKRNTQKSSWRVFPGISMRMATRATISCRGISGWLAAGLMPGGSSPKRSMPCQPTSGRARRRSPGWTTAISCSPGRSNSKTSLQKNEQNSV